MLNYILLIQAHYGLVNLENPAPNQEIFFNGSDDKVPVGVPYKYFKSLIAACKKDLVKTNYTTYSARTTFINNMLHAENSVFDIARYCGTSVQTIQDHYASKFDNKKSDIRILKKKSESESVGA